MSAVFVALALSMFGLYELQLPQSWTARLATTAGNKGSVGGAALLGFGSALIVGPCVTPPLAAALVFVAQTGEVARGSLALFALGLGMGLPLIAFGVLGARVLPRSGAWLARVKHIFGFVFIGLAIWMASRVLPVALTATAWGALFIAIGLYFDVPALFEEPRWQLGQSRQGQRRRDWRCSTAASRSSARRSPTTDRCSRWSRSAGDGSRYATVSGWPRTEGFQVVSNEADLDKAIDLGRRQGRASWSISPPTGAPSAG